MKLVKLEDVCYSGSSNISQKDVMILDGSYPIYGASGLIKNINFYKSEEPYIAIVKDGSGVGRIMILPEKSSVIGTMQYIFPRDNINIRYLYYAMTSMDLSKYCTGIAIPHIYFKDYKKEKLNLPSISEQVNIANKLDLVQKIIDLKQQQIKNLDELIKSQFIEMFDNTEEKIRLGDCCEVHARIGWQALTKNEHMQRGEYMLITGTDFKNNEIDYSTCVYVSKERYEMDKNIILKNDDILITKDGTIGKVAIIHNLNKPATLNCGIFVIRPDQKFNKEYIAYVFKGPLFEEYVDKSKTGATIKHLNQKHLIEFEIPFPSKKLQERFADIYKQINKQKFIIEKSLKETEKLQKSLMNKYFN